MPIYLDHNATTPLHPAAAAVWREAAEAGAPANPSSIHWAGRAARRRLTQAREEFARLLGVSPREVVFTASGTEANVTALRGVIRSASGARRRVLVSGLEHPSVLLTLEAIAREEPDTQLERLPVDASGVLDLAAAESLLSEDCLLVSLMLANNETGVMQPVRELALLARAHGVITHCDAAQAVGKLPVDAAALGVDLLTAGGHKFGGGLGMGLLLVRHGISLVPVLPGHQEGGRRGGTENVAAVVAAAAALQASVGELETAAKRVGALRDRFERELSGKMSGIVIHGAGAPRLPNTSLVGFQGTEGEALLVGLDVEGIAASSGAACASGSIEPSGVLLAMGASRVEAKAAVRFSLGASTTEAEIDRVLDVLPRIVAAVRREMLATSG